MALRSRVGHVESYGMRPRQVSEKVNASPSMRKGKGGTPKEGLSSSNSPILMSRQSAGDLMFQMDEEPVYGDSVKGKGAMRGVRLGESDSYPESPALGASIPEAESLGEQSFLGPHMSSPHDATHAESPTQSRANALHQKRSMATSPGSSAPWGSPSISGSKKDLKDIMGEVSESRVSNLTMEMAGRRESSGNFTPKISQKDRKKMQQQQMQEKLSAQQRAKDEPRNPWQLPPPATPSTPTKSPRSGPSGPSTPTPEPARANQKSAMTLRQTVAGTPPSQPTPITTPTQTKSLSVSANTPDFPPFPKLSPSGPSGPSQQPLKTSPQPSIQSIRHIPRPGKQTRSPSHGSLSLANILLQQQTEKKEIEDAALAKHNLQEIQAEQEFQQWWDQESKRVQGLLDTEIEPQDRGSKSGRGGRVSNTTGSSRKRRGNKAVSPSGNVTEPNQATPANGKSTTPKKKVNGQGPAKSPANAPGSQNATGSSRGARRGGHGTQRGRGRDGT